LRARVGAGMCAGMGHWRSRGMIGVSMVGCTLVEVRVLRGGVVVLRWRRAISAHALWTICVGPRLVGVVSLVGNGGIDDMWWLCLLWWVRRTLVVVHRRKGTRV
jgi:hypothetical protein